MPETKLKVALIAHTPDPVTVCALAARTCYSALTPEELREKVNEKDQGDVLKKVIASGHTSVLEHASFTFGVEGVSRVLLAQLTRHRIASFSVQSQRYVSLSEGFNYIVPPRIRDLGPEMEEEYRREMETAHQWYRAWQERLGDNANEDARFVLPSACETRITMTMNARELKHFFALRCCSRAQWEIRALADEMLRLVKAAAPAIFEDAGPGCVRGACPEGAKSCGRAQEIRKKYRGE